MGRQVFLFELDGKQVIGFDTGLDARAFARAKLAQLLTEHGVIVRPGNADKSADSKESGGSVELWKASGVIEYSGADGAKGPPTMVVWGPAVEGERLDLLVNDNARRDEALSAIALWIRAALTLEEKSRATVPLWPCAALVATSHVFFAPPSLALRCLRADEESLYSGYEWYVHPDFGGTELVHDQHEAVLPAYVARRSFGFGGFGNPDRNQVKGDLAKANQRTAFTAAAMLYRVFAGKPPFTATDDITLPQDMRDGNFLPIRLAVPGMDSQLADLVQRVLEPHGKRNAVNGTIMEKPSPGDLLAAIQQDPPGGDVSKHTSLTASVSSLVKPLSETDMQLLEKEKAQFLKIKTASVNTRRFVMRNAGILIGSLAALVVAIVFFATIANTRAARPTTEGMDPIQVVESYYNAFGELNHIFMENIVLRRVGRADIAMVVNLFVINRVRMAHEFSPTPLIISAMEWKESGGGRTDAIVFGVTDLQIEQVDGRSREPRRGRARRDESEEIHFRVDYLFWLPPQMLGGSDARMDARLVEGADEPPMPVSFQHTDIVTLVRRRGNWRISDIVRVVRS